MRHQSPHEAGYCRRWPNEDTLALNDLKRRLARMRSPEPRLPQLHRNFIGARSVKLFACSVKLVDTKVDSVRRRTIDEIFGSLPICRQVNFLKRYSFTSLRDASEDTYTPVHCWYVGCAQALMKCIRIQSEVLYQSRKFFTKR